MPSLLLRQVELFKLDEALLFLEHGLLRLLVEAEE